MTSFPSVPTDRRAASAAALSPLVRRVSENPEDVRCALRLAETAILAGDSETARAAFEEAYDLYLRSDFSLKAVAVAQMLVRLERFSAGAYL